MGRDIVKTSMYDQKRNVSELQSALRFMHLRGDAVPLVNPDGIFGEETAAALIAAQRFFALPETGVADYDTWTLIFEDYLRFLAETQRITGGADPRPYGVEYEVRGKGTYPSTT